MFVCTIKFDRKKAVYLVVMAALLLIGIIMLAGALSGARDKVASADLDTEAGRAAYLADCGWQVETPALSEENVLIPKSFSEVFENYNRLQLEQGFDLSKYAGSEVKLYTYRVTNHESGDAVLAQLYIHKGKVIGGDIHSSSLDGFMCGIRDGK